MSEGLSEYLRTISRNEGAVVIGFTKIRKVEPVIILGFPFTDNWFLRHPLRVATFLTKDSFMSKHVQDILAKVLHTEGYTASYKTVWSIFGDFRPLAVAAGLGDWGRHGLVVNQEYGSALLFAAIFTNAPLKTTQPADNKDSHCTACEQCIGACPAKAFGQNGIQLKRCLPYCLKGCAECVKMCTKKSIPFVH